MKRISIANDFSDTPLGRYPGDGPFSGTKFREEYLRPALTGNDKVIVDLEGVEGFGSSFLEEAFGGLVREGYFSAEDLKKRLEIIHKSVELAMYSAVIWEYISKAKKK